MAGPDITMTILALAKANPNLSIKADQFVQSWLNIIEFDSIFQYSRYCDILFNVYTSVS